MKNLKKTLWPRYKFLVDYIGILIFLYLIDSFRYGIGNVPDYVLIIDSIVAYLIILLSSLGDIFGKLKDLEEYIKEKDKE